MTLSGLFNRLLRYLARRGLRDATRLIPSESTRIAQPTRPAPPPQGQMRLHLFGANFDSQAAAEAFCLSPPGTELPSALTQQLSGAFVDDAQVEAVHDDIPNRLAEFLDPEGVDDVLLRLAGDNTLIILTELAFGGLPYTLDDTTDLTYLGDITVAV
ncbi:hypothetical protein SAMN05428995_104207 [Loktanella sp. DSM 29012]|uniref:hypothetical protein n=1 Tax=Loktanella sp. DSM 29012 TaxID=1881056 RepID=UPI0008BFDEB5|nr:hypothetical protein [Loktanella sp. DSM 29012]SEQ42084.1 hypothetical protein SAMN05428995_104207 [Loktanella sp. DSM 29012]